MHLRLAFAIGVTLSAVWGEVASAVVLAPAFGGRSCSATGGVAQPSPGFGSDLLTTVSLSRCFAAASEDGPRAEGWLELRPGNELQLGMESRAFVEYQYAVVPDGTLPDGVTTVPVQILMAGDFSGTAAGTAVEYDLEFTFHDASGIWHWDRELQCGLVLPGGFNSCPTAVPECHFGLNGADPGVPAPPCDTVQRTFDGSAEPDVAYDVRLETYLLLWGDSADGGDATAEMWIDPIIRVHPFATFGEGLLYADFFHVVQSANVTPGIVTEPASIGLVALGTAAALARRRSAAAR